MISNLSFEEVACKFEPIIKGQIKRLRIYKDHEVFYQHGLIGLWEAHKEYNPARGTFQTFAITKVRGKMLDQLKKEKLYQNRYTHVDFQQYEEIPDIHVNMDIFLEEELIERYCSGLSPEQTTWVIKAILEQKKPSEIAEELNVSVERVKSWRKQAIKKITRGFGS